MDRLLLDLLAYGRASRVELELTPVETQRAWESAIFQCASQIEQTRAQIETVSPLPKVHAHEATLGQILANLLSNSLKFVPSGIQPHVRIWSEDCNGCQQSGAATINHPSSTASVKQDQPSTINVGQTDRSGDQPSTPNPQPMCRLWIEDNGIGISPEHRDRVFRVFERLNGALYPGTGIGLSIVRKGIERMGGYVGLESSPAHGTRFWIELPKAA
jgi:signal transduction histidine kinase